MAARVAGYLLILSAFGTRAPLAAQSPQPDPTQIFRSFRFVATGTNGQPVTDLRRQEIRVSDEGHREPLVFMRLLSAPTAAALGPGEFSNRAHDQFSASTIILLDLLNANITERGAAWYETNQLLEGLDHAENVFLFLLTPDASLYAVHAWPGPGAPAEPSSAPWTRQVRQLLDQALHKVERIKPIDLTAAPGLTVEPTYRGLAMLGRQYAAVPGQKRIIWVTHGIPLAVPGLSSEYVDFTPLLKQAAAEFRQLGIEIYTVHQQDRSNPGINSQETLQLLPPLTGGRWFENDAVGHAFTQAQADARGTYQAAYYAPAKDDNGKFHKLRVSTTRKGVRILAEQGYTAEPAEAIARNNLGLVESRSLETPDIGLRASLDTSGERTRFQIRVDPRDLLLQHGEHAYTGALTLVLLYSHADGSPNVPEVQKVNMRLTQEQLDAAMKDGYPAGGGQTVPAGTRQIRVVVQDAATGMAGSLDIPISAGPPKP